MALYRGYPTWGPLTNLNQLRVSDVWLDTALGNNRSYSTVHKFGFSNVGTSMQPITHSGEYRTPTSATALEFVSSSSNDTSGGSGAREITVVGLNSDWEEVTQTVTTNGTTAVALGTNLIRLYRWYVSSSGTYATSSAGSHAGTLTIRVASGGATWTTIPITPFPMGQSLISAYTVPTGKTGYVLGENLFIDNRDTADIIFFQRPNADDVSSPYSGAMRTISYKLGLQGNFADDSRIPKGPFVGPCDIGYMGKVDSGTGDISAEFDLLIVDT